MATAEDWDTLARTIFGEARGESFLGQVAVAWVIKNRADRAGWWGGPDIESVCRRHAQFSCWTPGDPNLPVIQAAQPSDPHFLTALGIAALVMQRHLSDPTNGATNYYAASIPPPAWSLNMVPLGQIGGHFFLREA